MSWGVFFLGFAAGCVVVGLAIAAFVWQVWKDVEGRR